jgi:hypothetical protein
MPHDPNQEQKRPPRTRSEFRDALWKGALVGAGLLMVIIPAMRMLKEPPAPQPPAQVATAPQPVQPAQPAPQPDASVQPPVAAAPPQATPPAPEVRLANFRGEPVSDDARLVANWVAATRDNKKQAFVIVDKKDARVYVFSPDGTLKDSAPALLGSARGDDTYPGVGDKPLSAVKPHEKTTPAGRFVAEPGINANKEDIIWVDYDAAVSMHRVRPLVAKERRLERLATLVTDDNRISFGCINLPVSFYENVLSPTVKKQGAIVYVLPEVKSVQKVLGAYDVTDPQQVAAAQKGKEAVQKVALRR